jgi:hypothetical protein
MKTIFIASLFVAGGYILGYKHGYDVVQRDVEKIIKKVMNRR